MVCYFFATTADSMKTMLKPTFIQETGECLSDIVSPPRSIQPQQRRSQFTANITTIGDSVITSGMDVYFVNLFVNVFVAFCFLILE